MAQSIGVVGCGAIGQALLRAADSGKLNVPVAGVTSRDKRRASEFLSSLDLPPPYLDRQELIQKSDLLVEAAGGHIVADLAKETFASRKDLMVISIGALLDNPGIIEEAREGMPPSGSIWGYSWVGRYKGCLYRSGRPSNHGVSQTTYWIGGRPPFDRERNKPGRPRSRNGSLLRDSEGSCQRISGQP